MKHFLLAFLFLFLIGCDQQHNNDEVALKRVETDVTASVSAEEAMVAELLTAIETGAINVDDFETAAGEETAAMPPPTLAFGEVMPTMPNPDSILDQMFNVDISFVIPVEANIEDSVRAELIITPEAINATLNHTVDGMRQEATILVTQVVRADLRTDDFDVTAITSTEQVLLKTESTQWLWKLRPLHPGDAEVVLTVTAIVKTDFGNSQRQMKAFEKTIDINITKRQIVMSFIEDNWQWLWSTLFVPVVLLLYRRFKKKD